MAKRRDDKTTTHSTNVVLEASENRFEVVLEAARAAREKVAGKPKKTTERDATQKPRPYHFLYRRRAAHSEGTGITPLSDPGIVIVIPGSVLRGGMTRKGETSTPAITGDDVRRSFEEALTEIIGDLGFPAETDDSETEELYFNLESVERALQEEFSWLEPATATLSSANENISERIKSFESRLEALEAEESE